jgi:hypothetical protein
MAFLNSASVNVGNGPRSSAGRFRLCLAQKKRRFVVRLPQPRAGQIIWVNPKPAGVTPTPDE